MRGHQNQHGLLALINETGCKLEWLVSLMEVLIEHLDQMHERLDPYRSAKLAADIGRIAYECLAQLSVKMADAEERWGSIDVGLPSVKPQ